MRRYTIAIDDRAFTIDVVETAADRFEVTVDGQTFEATLHADEDLPGAAISPGMAVPDDARAPQAASSDPTARPPAVAPATSPRPGFTPAAGSPAGSPRTGQDLLVAPMPGVVLEVLAGPGTILGRGDPVLVLEAMKMRNLIRAPRPAVVATVEVEAGQPVAAGDPLVRFDPAPG